VGGRCGRAQSLVGLRRGPARAVLQGKERVLEPALTISQDHPKVRHLAPELGELAPAHLGQAITRGGVAPVFRGAVDLPVCGAVQWHGCLPDGGTWRARPVYGSSPQATPRFTEHHHVECEPSL
jgi:hypothetical protein